MTDKTKLEQVRDALKLNDCVVSLYLSRPMVQVIQEALIAYADQIENGGWRDIKSAPRDGTEIIIFDDSTFGNNQPCLAAWAEETEYEDAGWVDVQDEDNILGATHWMPQPPKGDE